MALGRACDSGQTVLELVNRFGADGWELAGLQDYRDGGDGTSFWEAARLLAVYTIKRPVPRIAQSQVPSQALCDYVALGRAEIEDVEPAHAHARDGMIIRFGYPARGTRPTRLITQS
jgi:hypothetical protein